MYPPDTRVSSLSQVRRGIFQIEEKAAMTYTCLANKGTRDPDRDGCRPYITETTRLVEPGYLEKYEKRTRPHSCNLN